MRKQSLWRTTASGADRVIFYAGQAAEHVSTGHSPGDGPKDSPENVVTLRIAPLRLEAFEQLPKHARRCVFWEVDPSAMQGGSQLADPEFEKEAWLSMVMLEWGSCAQVAVYGRDNDEGASTSEGVGDGPCVGYAFYAPPGAVPRARRFPTGPVSADAVLLTSIGAENGPGIDGLPYSLLDAVVDQLVRRGVRALEAFGRTPEVAELPAAQLVQRDLRPVVEALGDCSVNQCVIGTDFLQDAGFEVIAPHHYFPRLRLELEQGLGWKADVEAALERLLESARLQQSVGARN